MDDRIGDEHPRIGAVLPALVVAPLDALALFDRIHQRGQEHLVVIGEPTGGALAQQFFHHGVAHREVVFTRGAGGGVFRQRRAYVRERQGNQERRTSANFHLPVPRAQHGDQILQVGDVRVAVVVSRHQLPGQELAERRIHVALDAEHVFRPPALARLQTRPHLAGAVWRRKAAADRVRIVVGKRVLIGSGDDAAGRVEGGGEIGKRNEAVPFEIAGRSIQRHVARIAAPYRQSAGHLVANVAVRIGVDEVGSRARQALQGGSELHPGLRAIDIEKWILNEARFGGDPPQRHWRVVLIDKQRPVAGDPDRHFLRVLVLHADDFALQPRLFRLTSV